jgi:glycosyltransferase involved in cell wall biosynthesis
VNFLLINYEYPPIGGGAATATFHIAREIAGMGHDVTVLTSRFRKEKDMVMEAGVRIIRCSALRKKADRSNIFEMFTFVSSACLNLRKILKNHHIEVAIVFFVFPCGPIGLLGWYIAGVPYVISLRGGDVPGADPQLDFLHKILQPVRRLLYRHSKAIVANSDGLRELAQRSDSYSAQIIHNGVDTVFYSPQVHKNEEIPAFLFVGRFSEEKNLFYLLNQISHLRQSCSRPFRLSLVGDGPLRGALVNLAMQLKVDDLITWHGWLNKDQLRDVYRSAYCLLLPSLNEGMPNVVLEAMACGLPVIASRVIGNATVVRHGETGFLFDLKEPTHAIEAMKNVLENSDLAHRMGEQGRSLVLQDYSWEKTAEAYVGLFLGCTVPSDSCLGVKR